DITIDLTSGFLCDNLDNYNLSIGSIETNELTYFINDKRLDPELVDRTVAEYELHSNIKVTQVYSIKEADILIDVQEIDGIGNVLGNANYPSSIYKRGEKPRPLILDEHDFFGEG